MNSKVVGMMCYFVSLVNNITLVITTIKDYLKKKKKLL